MSSTVSPATGPYPAYPPSEWYTSPEVFALEQDRLFDRLWSLVATAEQLSRPGDYVTAQVGRSLLLLACDEGGTIRAHHNMCRHRGLPLVEGSGSCGRFLTCPYHQWSFDTAGNLVRVPQEDEQFPGLDRRNWSLLPARAEVWHGMVFAHPEAEGPPLRQSLGFLADRLDPFLSGPLIEMARVEYTAECNWKLLVENHIDVYHLWYVHNRSLNMYDHRKFEWEFDTGNWWSLEPLKEPPSRFPLDWVPDDQRNGIGAHLLFPNVMMACTGDYFATYDAAPIAPGRTRLTLRVRATAGADADKLVKSVRSFLAEDVAICESLQAGAASSRFATGPLAATHEAPIRAFHSALAERCHG